MSIQPRKGAKALVLDAEWPAALETIQSLGRLGITVHASATADCLAFRSRYLAATKTQPSTNSELIAWINDQHALEAYDLIVPATERALTAFLSPHISPQARTRAVLAANESLRAALEKETTRQLATSLGLRVPHTRLVDRHSTPPAAFPVVLKPVTTKRLHGDRVEHFTVTVAPTLEVWTSALRDLYADIEVQEQEYVTGRGIGVEMLFDHGQLRWTFLHERLHEVPLTGGGSSYRRSLPLDPALIAPAEKLLRALAWHGVAMVEFKQTPSGDLYLVEINPRLWGSLALAIDAGVDFPAGLLSLATGTPLPPQPTYRTGYRTRNLANDLLWTKCNLLADHTDPILHTRPRLRSLLEYALPLLGHESWDFFDWRDLSVTSTQLRNLFSHTLHKITQPLATRSEANKLFTAQQRNLPRLAQLPKKSLLFLCYGNICRSPLAAALATKALATNPLAPNAVAANAVAPNAIPKIALPAIQVQSAGFHPRTGRPSPDFMQTLATSAAIDLSQHRSARVTQQQIDAADLILLMDRRNYTDLQRDFPAACDKALFLGLFASPPRLEIADPYDRPFAEAQQIAADLQTCIHNLTHWLRSTSPTT